MSDSAMMHSSTPTDSDCRESAVDSQLDPIPEAQIRLKQETAHGCEFFDGENFYFIKEVGILA
jgi:hypothetical protein